MHKKKWYAYSILIFPWLLKFIINFWFLKDSVLKGEDYLEDGAFFLMTLLLLGIAEKVNPVWKIPVLAGYFLSFAIEIGTLFIVKSGFSSSFVYVLLDTNIREFTEFTEVHWKHSVGLIILVLFIVFVAAVKLRHYFTVRYPLGVLLGAVLGLFLLLKVTGIITYNPVYNVIRGAYGYYDLRVAAEKGTDINPEDLIVSGKNDLIVVVIGESTSRLHMSLYGYPRKTTPQLEQLKNELVVYTNVIAPHTYTSAVIPKVLTTANYENPDGNTHLIELFKKSGYTTYWISNQRPIGFFENVVSKLASESDYFKFLRIRPDQETNAKDAVVLPYFKKIVEKPGKKIVFVHLLGTHYDYQKRYTPDFNVFRDKTGDAKKQTRAHYDNAVLYNDYIVGGLLKLTKSLRTKSAFLFFSDHGEEVYDSIDFLGHSEANPTKPMFEIPFIFWKSENFELPGDVEFQPDRPYMIDDLFYSLAHIGGIKSPTVKTNRSIFSKEFMLRKRIVLDTIDYDKYESLHGNQR